MNRLLYILALAISCTACDTKTSSTSSSGTTETTPESPLGATSIAGITPGKTTLEELRNLVTNPGLNNSSYQTVNLKELNEISAYIFSENGLVYRVKISATLNSGIAPALVEKYGTPKTKKGGINEVTCQNGLGASFQRLGGTEDLLWKPNAGIQAYFHKWTGDCGEEVYQDYIIEHVATVQILEAAQEAKKAKTILNEVDKVKAGL